jgi:hypothetical protein
MLNSEWRTFFIYFFLFVQKNFLSKNNKYLNNQFLIKICIATSDKGHSLLHICKHGGRFKLGFQDFYTAIGYFYTRIKLYGLLDWKFGLSTVQMLEIFLYSFFFQSSSLSKQYLQENTALWRTAILPFIWKDYCRLLRTCPWTTNMENGIKQKKTSGIPFTLEKLRETADVIKR